MSENYDLVIIGTGPGGYVCAIRAAQLGMKVAVVEKRSTHGGTCLNIGCIPSKALLHTSELFEEAGGHFAKMGIQVGTPKLDLAAMMSFKQDAVTGNTKGIEFLFKKNKITSFHGTGVLTAPGVVEIGDGNGGSETLNGKNIVIATGSDVMPLPGVEIDEKQIISSTGALTLENVPRHMLVIGGGVVGLELGSVWRRLGADVTVVEFLDHILPGMDREISTSFEKILRRQGMTIELSSKVTGVEKTGNGLQVTVEPAAGGDAKAIETDSVLVAIGRQPHTSGLGLENIGVAVDDRGRIEVDDDFKTNIDGIYAIGDVIRGAMLAHKAEDEGVALAEKLAGQKPHIDYNLIPDVVYTTPEVAAVGKTEEQLQEEGTGYNTGKFLFIANGRAKANDTTDGFVKILADKKTDRVLGVHMLGANVSELIAEATLAMEFGASAEDIARTCHAHPSLAEAVKEAALAVDNRPIHM